MHELRLVAVSEDGTYVVLAQPGRGTRFSLPNDERLRAVVRGQFSRLAQYEIEVESLLRPKEIQARIRSGETAEQIADAAGVPIERVRWFEGPVLAERAYIAQQAQTAAVGRPGDSGPGPRLGETVTERLRRLGADPEEAQWDSRKRGDGSWLVELTCEADEMRVTGAWVFDPRRRHVTPEDEVAARLSLSDDALQAAGLTIQPPAAARAGGTVTPFVPRSGQTARPEHAVPPDSAQVPDRAPGAARVAAGNRGARLPGGQQSPAEAVSHAPPATAPPPWQPPSAATAAVAVEAAEPPAADAAAAAEAADAAARGRPARKAAGGRGRRASVPTWDEIMFGSSRRQD